MPCLAQHAAAPSQQMCVVLAQSTTAAADVHDAHVRGTEAICSAGKAFLPPIHTCNVAFTTQLQAVCVLGDPPLLQR